MTDFETLYKDLVQFDRHLGMDLTVNAPGDVTYVLEIQNQHLTSPDASHGGVLSAMMDAVLGVAALSWAVSKGNLCSTVEFKINFLRPAAGDYLSCKSTVIRNGSRIIIAESEVSDRRETSETLVAKALVTLTSVPESRLRSKG